MEMVRTGWSSGLKFIRIRLMQYVYADNIGHFICF